MTLEQSGQVDDMMDVLASERPFPDVPPVFIRAPGFGTRCSTVIVIDCAGQGLITERRFVESGEIEGETVIAFRWPI